MYFKHYYSFINRENSKIRCKKWVVEKPVYYSCKYYQRAIDSLNKLLYKAMNDSYLIIYFIYLLFSFKYIAGYGLLCSLKLIFDACII